MPYTIVALSDTHFASEPCGPQRHGEIADILLRRAVHRINRFIKPDVVVLLGDLVNDGNAAEAPDRLRHLREIMNLLHCPSIVLPGNHDGDIDAFYRVFTRPPDMVDIDGVRFLPFFDPEEPGYNGRRTPEDLARMASARVGFDGPLVALQHMSVSPPGCLDCPYYLVNIDEVMQLMTDSRFTLSIGGHFHRGIDLLSHSSGHFLVVPALCEPPFPFMKIMLDGERIFVEQYLSENDELY